MHLVSTHATHYTRYHNPDPLVWLLGHANEAADVVEGVETMALVDTGSQMPALTERFFTEMGLRILPLGDLLHLEGMGTFCCHIKDM